MTTNQIGKMVSASIVLVMVIVVCLAIWGSM